MAVSFAQYIHSIFRLPYANDERLLFNNMSNFIIRLFDEKLANDSLKRMK